MTLAMSWHEWAAHDALALAERVRQGEVTPAELAAQVAAGIARTNGELDAVVEVFDDVVADPLADGMRPDGVFAGVPYLMKDAGPTLQGETAHRWTARHGSRTIRPCARAGPCAREPREIHHDRHRRLGRPPG